MATTNNDAKASTDKQKPAEPMIPAYKPRGGPTQSDFTKYDIENLQYPKDLMSPDGRYGFNYVVFYINVSTESKLLKQGGTPTIDDKDVPPRDAGEIRNLSAGQLTGGTAALGALGTVAGGLLGVPSAGAAAAAASTVGVGIATGAGKDAGKKRGMKRLKSAIALHVPNQLNIRYGMQYSEEDTAMLQMAAAAGGEVLKALTSAGKNSDVTGVAGDIITNLTLGNAPGVSAATGLAANPKKEQVFKSVDFRTFQVDYQFFPRDTIEAGNVLRIIQEFKYHMHPEFKDGNNFIYIYPSEFDIYYYQGGQENLTIHRHTSCVLTEMNINYTPNGVFTTFSNGMPTQINVQMTFRELALLTKDKIKDGL
jgi:hypothetical protein